MMVAHPDSGSAIDLVLIELSNKENGKSYTENSCTVQRPKLCLSELAVNDICIYCEGITLSDLFLLCGVPVLRHCDVFVTNFTAAKFRALNYFIMTPLPNYITFIHHRSR
ncbi:hypothetical protein EVAR_40440_1 [Eumeta japonica]|uniref:Uncharacterized protein n=1 Tax=Eumeta variegata TaxID=151549 RepID=A0A4C1X253_EUMVA|nr:hypothetical protein EVAR_40440_1 [Eumeta japonica]